MRPAARAKQRDAGRFFRQSITEVIAALGTDVQRGLRTNEAQARLHWRRMKQFGLSS